MEAIASADGKPTSASPAGTSNVHSDSGSSCRDRCQQMAGRGLLEPVRRHLERQTSHERCANAELLSLQPGIT